MPTHHFPTASGFASVSWNEHGLTNFRLPEVVESLDAAPATLHPAEIEQLVVSVQDHFAGKLHDFSQVALDWSLVTNFQKKVYREAITILPGRTTTYGEIARRLGLGPEGSRAVGVALGANPWPLIVPCHRVLAASGKMTGFSAPGGIRTKTRLLALEGAELLSE